MDSLIRRQKGLILYLLISVLATVLDTAAVWLLFATQTAGLVLANTIGVVLGFLLHYLLASGSVFHARYGLAGFAVYLGTFLFGLGLADMIIAVSYRLTQPLFSESVSFILSKGLSVALPFFVLYYLRLTLYRRLK